MTIKPGDKLPNVKIAEATAEGPKPVSSLRATRREPRSTVARGHPGQGTEAAEPANTLLPSASVMREAFAVCDPSFAR